MLTAIALLDRLLDLQAAVLGEDFTAYRNHTYRVVNLSLVQSSKSPEQLEKLAIAAAFHDIGREACAGTGWRTPIPTFAPAVSDSGSAAVGILKASHRREAESACLVHTHVWRR